MSEVLNQEAVPMQDVAADTQESWFQRHKRGAGALAAGLLVVAGAGLALEACGDDETSAASDKSDIAGLLTVDTSEVDCVAVVEQAKTGQIIDLNGTKAVRLEVGAVKPVPPRLWSDAISTPFETPKEAGKEALLLEMQAAICEDPELGSTVANMFANMEVEGVKVVDLNPWLQPYQGDPATINDNAAKAIPLMDRDPASITDEEIDTAVDANLSYKMVAEKLATMLTRFQNAGVETGMTTFNYNLVAGGLVVGGLPEVGLNPTQYDAEALRLVLTKKDGQCLVEIGFNLGDKRPEGFTCEVTVGVPGVSLPEQPGTTVPGGHGSTTTTHPKGSTTTTTIPDKNPGLSSNNPIVAGPDGGPGAGGQPGPEGTTSTTTSTTRIPNTTTTRAGGTTTTTAPAGECGAACE